MLMKRGLCIIAMLALGETIRLDLDKNETIDVEAAADETIDVEAAAENLEAEEQAFAEDLAEDLAEERDAAANPYWDENLGKWEFVAPLLKNTQYVQQFEIKEGSHFVNKKYTVKLEELEDPNTGMEVKKHIDKQVLKVDNYFWTMHNHQLAVFETEEGTQAGEYLMFKPSIINRRYTWRVVKMDDKDKVLFTIQKRLYNDHCKHLNLFKCLPVLKIYVGHRGDKSTLIYYGVGDKDLDEPDFKFYHSVAEYAENKRNWAAKVYWQKGKKMKLDLGEGTSISVHYGSKKGKIVKDTYKVKVQPNEDAGLILLSAVALDRIGDDAS